MIKNEQKISTKVTITIIDINIRNKNIIQKTWYINIYNQTATTICKRKTIRSNRYQHYKRNVTKNHKIKNNNNIEGERQMRRKIGENERHC